MKYSIIIPFHSNINLLTACVSSLFLSIDKEKGEIIIVDNNAGGSQIQKDSPLRKVCRIITKQENLLYPKAINLGASEAKGDKLIFCDADTFVLPGFQAKLLASLSDKNVGYASAKLLNMGSNRIQEFGITYSYYNFPHPFAGRPINHPLVALTHYPLAACAAYFIFDCSTIGNSDLYLNYLVDRLDLSISDTYKHPYNIRDAVNIDLLNFVSYHIRNYNIPILYFTDCLSAFEGNGLWKRCRERFADIVVDRHANIEFLKDIRL